MNSKAVVSGLCDCRFAGIFCGRLAIKDVCAGTRPAVQIKVVWK